MHIELSYNVPITEGSNDDSNFIIQGVAINSTTTENNHKFLPEELRLSASSLKNVPLLVDHRNEVSAIKGRVFEARFDEAFQNVPFRAKVVDKEAQAMIKDGRLNSVSIGATVKDVEEVNGVLIPRGITFKELSLVAVPADPNATFTTALSEAWKSTHNESISKNLSIDSNLLKGGQEKTNTMSTEIQNSDKVEVVEAKEVTEKSDTELEQLRAIVSEYKAKERKQLEENYKALCKEKGVESLNVSEFSEKTIEMLIEQIKKVTIAPVAEKKTSEVTEELEEVETSVESKYKIMSGNGSIRGGSFWVE